MLQVLKLLLRGELHFSFFPSSPSSWATINEAESELLTLKQKVHKWPGQARTHLTSKLGSSTHCVAGAEQDFGHAIFSSFAWGSWERTKTNERTTSDDKPKSRLDVLESKNNDGIFIYSNVEIDPCCKARGEKGAIFTWS